MRVAGSTGARCRILLGLLLLAASPIAAQKPAAGASAILVGTVAAPGVADRTLAEGYVTQPMLMGMLPIANGRVTANATLNFEWATLERGELNAGVYGEGYIDRRHPHTWIHEAVLTGLANAGQARFSVTVGKGFIPFGTDDPMSRPFVKYPVNHHLAQLLERAGVIGAVAYGPLILEASTFNGDEPESPGDRPAGERIGDSWSARATGARSGLEVQGSVAHVVSPEIAVGGGLDHLKWSASARFENAGRYALVEWAQTSERDRGETAFTFSSVLAEGSAKLAGIQLSMRAERTERPEEERLTNVFRTPRPHSDLSILGRTRWDVLSASASAPVRRGRALFAPFVEISTQKPAAIAQPAAFEPREFYGASRLWSFSAGVRLGFGMIHSRMGRYGVAVVQPMSHGAKAEEHVH